MEKLIIQGGQIMNLIKKKKLSTIVAMFTLFAVKSNAILATGIGTAEVQTATDNIKRVITSIAMPLGRCSHFRKYCGSCN